MKTYLLVILIKPVRILLDDKLREVRIALQLNKFFTLPLHWAYINTRTFPVLLAIVSLFHAFSSFKVDRKGSNILRKCYARREHAFSPECIAVL
jgi:hypothetical protein